MCGYNGAFDSAVELTRRARRQVVGTHLEVPAAEDQSHLFDLCDVVSDDEEGGPGFLCVDQSGQYFWSNNPFR